MHVTRLYILHIYNKAVDDAGSSTSWKKTFHEGGPRTVAWKTVLDKGIGSEAWPFTITFADLSAKKPFKKFNILGPTFALRNFPSKFSVNTLSKAPLMSLKKTPTLLPKQIASIHVKTNIATKSR